MHPDLAAMCYGLPRFWIKLLLVIFRHVDWRNQASIRPFANLVVRPDHYIRAFAGLRSHRETVCDVLRSLDPDLYAQIRFEFSSYRFQRVPALIVHPDQKFTIGPCKQLDRKQKESRQRRQQPLHAQGITSRVLMGGARPTVYTSCL